MSVFRLTSRTMRLSIGNRLSQHAAFVASLSGSRSHILRHGCAARVGWNAAARRRQSSVPQNGNSSPGREGASLNARPSGRQVLVAAIRQSFRHLGGAFRGQSLRTIFRQNPEELILALVLLAACALAALYVARLYFTYFNSSQFTRYPPPVAKSLRRALYYSDYNPKPKLALRYYKRALEQCEALKLDPLSDEVTGIKIKLAAWFEKIGNYNNAIKVLEELLGDCVRWVGDMDKAVPSADTELQVYGASRPLGIDTSEAAGPESTPETVWGKRNRILGKAIGISVKLGELYSDEHVMKPELAHQRLTWAVERALGELHRRSTDGVKAGEGAWMDNEAIGGAIEALGHSYEARSQFDLAAPLFLQALRLCRDACHSAVLMNNLAASIAQHPDHVSFQTSLGAVLPPSTPPATAQGSPAVVRKSNLAAAQRWARNALDHARATQGEDRSPECDQACAAALYNLGDIAFAAGDAREARRLFEECVTLSRQVGFAQGAKLAQDGLQRLKGQQ